MKKILFFIAIFFSLKGFSQYPNTSSPSSDSTLTKYRGAFKSRLINLSYADTTQANTERISFYDGAQIFTRSGGVKFWIRDSANKIWVRIGNPVGGSGISGTFADYGLVQVNDSTLAVDTTLIATILQVQHRIDSLAAAGRTELGDSASAIRGDFPTAVDTLNKWIQDTYARNDSLFKQKNVTETLIERFYPYNTNPLGYLTSVDTSSISSFWQKVRSLFSATYPITYSNGNNSLDTSNFKSDGFNQTKYQQTNPSYSFNEHSLISDTTAYSAFPSVAWAKNDYRTVEMVFKESGNHAADGPLMWTISSNGFSDYYTGAINSANSNPDTLTVGGTNKTGSVAMIGKGNGTRWTLCYGRDGIYDTLFFAKNDNNTKDFTATTSLVASASSFDWFFPYGKVLQLNGDTLLMSGYGLRTGQSKTDAIYFKTVDNGDTWTYGGIIVANSSLGSSTPSEVGWEIYSQGATVATTKIIATVRDDFYKGYHIQVISTDGGTTWTNLLSTQGDFAFHAVNANVVDNSWPCMLIKRGDWLYAIMGVRSQLSAGGMSFRVFRTLNPESINAWEGGTTTPKYYTIYRAANSYKGLDLDFGYGWPYFSPEGEMRVVFYDISTNYTPSYSNKFTVIKSIPILGNNYCEFYNNSNQSISSATKTKVSFPVRWYDSEQMFNSDSSKLYVRTDGYYTVEARFQVDTSSLGTYRKATLEAIDWGQAYGASPQYSIINICAPVTIAPNTNSDFCWIELRGQMFLWAGMEVRVSLIHDKGSALNIINPSDFEESDGARIRIKKIN